MKRLLALLLISSTVQAAELKESQANPGEIRVLAVDPTPEPVHVRTIVYFPRDNSVVDEQPVNFQVKIEGYPLQIESDFERRKDLQNDPKGQSLRVIVDDLPPFSMYQSVVDNLDDSENYYDLTLNQDLPFHFKPGQHFIRIFPIRTFGEALKDPGSYEVITFYYKSKTPTQNVDLDKPYLTYNEPQGTIKYRPNKPVLLDFLLAHAQLTKDGYKVRLTIDGKDVRVLTQWVPYYIYGLKPGEHRVRLELIDARNTKVSGAFNDVEKKFTLR